MGSEEANMKLEKQEKRGSGLPDWMKPFERIDSSSNFDDFACYPHEETEYFSGLEANKEGIQIKKSNESAVTVATPIARRPDLPQLQKTPPLQSLIKESAFLEACLSAGSSTEGTPVGTPQNSPYVQRKTLSNSEAVKAIGNHANSKRWFYQGLFGNADTPVASAIPHSSSLAVDGKTDTSSLVVDGKTDTSKPFKKFSVSNFDINAISPTSW